MVVPGFNRLNYWSMGFIFLNCIYKTFYMKSKILIVDDYNIFRKGLKLLIEKYENFEVIGEAAGSEELFEFLKNNEPELIVMDIMLQQEDVISISKKLHHQYQHIPFIIITVNAIEYTVMQCVINGASGFLWKESTEENLVEAINSVLAGERYFIFPASKMVDEVLSQTKENHSYGVEFFGLSEREIEVLKHIAEGESHKEIAEKLKISPRTVESHKNNILSKLKLHSSVELIKFAIQQNIIKLF